MKKSDALTKKIDALTRQRDAALAAEREADERKLIALVRRAGLLPQMLAEAETRAGRGHRNPRTGGQE